MKPFTKHKLLTSILRKTYESEVTIQTPEPVEGGRLRQAQPTGGAEQLQSEELPAVSAVVVRGGEVIWQESYGYADLETKRKADADTLYHVGSVTKIFTATMLMQLYERGQLALNDTVDRYLPELTAYPPMTLQQLVSHTSGLPMMPPLPELVSIMQEFPPVVENLRKIQFPLIDEIVDSLSEVALLTSLGAQVVYSNLGIALLAHAMERLTGQAYTAYIHDEIFAPLGMTKSGFWPEIGNAATIATCYLPFEEPLIAAPAEMKDIGGFTPVGGLCSSINDMARFLVALTSATDTTLLSPQSKQTMVTMVAPVEQSQSHYTGQPVSDALGVGIATGWFLAEIDGHRLAEHGGADPSTAAYVGWIPELELAAFMGTNIGKNPVVVGKTFSELLETVINSQ